MTQQDASSTVEATQSATESKTSAQRHLPLLIVAGVASYLLTWTAGLFAGLLFAGAFGH